MSDLGRPVDILMMTMKGRCRNLRQRPENGSNPEADPANINFVGLELQLRDNAHRARALTLRGNPAERG